MAHTTSEMLWVQSLLNYLGINVPIPMLMYCDNQTAISIAKNLVFHECTKHIVFDCHFIRDLLMKKQIVTPFIRSDDQLGDILTNPLAHSDDQLGDILTNPLAHASFQRLYFKQKMFDLYAAALGEVLELLLVNLLLLLFISMLFYISIKVFL